MKSLVAYDYMEMFRGVVTDFPGQLESIRREVRWAKTLRKRDCITWLLRWLRMEIYDGIAFTLRTESDPARRALAAKYSRLLAAEMQRLGWSERDRLYLSLHQAKDSIVHYLGIPAPAIQDKVWGTETPRQLLGGFEEAETDWKGAGSDRALVPHEDDQIVLEFPDGWAWWLLGRGYCPEEAKAMGHCGNVAGQGKPGQRILSLRRPVKGPEGREAWEPHLTFILHTAQKALGEMKGRGNEKPAARYHPYIAALLESPVVDKVWGGGYLPENNFSVADLPKDVQERLVKGKPALMTFGMRLGREGLTDKLVEDVAWKLELRPDDWSPRLRAFRIGAWKSAMDFVESVGTERTRQAIRLVLDGESVPTADDMGEDEYVLETLRVLTPENLKRVMDYARRKDPKALEWWTSNKGSPRTPEDIALMIKETDLSDVRKTLYHCWYGGQRNGTVFRLLRACRDEAEKLDPITAAGTKLAWGDPSQKDAQRYADWPDGLLLATPLWETVRIEDAVAIADDEAEDPRGMPLSDRWDTWEIELQPPPDGWEDFSTRAVNREAEFFFKGRGYKGIQAGLDDSKVSYDYMEMFRGLLADLPRFQPSVASTIDWCKRVLRKRDRITWWLRWMRLFWYSMASDPDLRYTPQGQPLPIGTPNPLAAKYNDLFAREVRTMGPGYSDNDLLELGMYANTHKAEMEHLLSLPVPEIQRFVWGRQSKRELFGILQGYEERWKEETKGVLSPRPGDRPVITFGDGWAWWLLDRGYCPEEARAMGHCGNVAGQYNADQRILSLRQSVRRGREEYYEPHLTFILDTKDRSLGEMKGKGNEKPTARYHPYIVALLESGIVSRVRGGGYLPENNFSVADLPQAEQDRLVALKPSLMTFVYRLGKEGETEAFLNDLKMVLLSPYEQSYKNDWYVPGRHGFLVSSYTLQGFLDEHGGKDSQGAGDILEGRKDMPIRSDGGYWVGWESGGYTYDAQGYVTDSPGTTLSSMDMTTLGMAERYYRGLAAHTPYDQVRRKSTGPVRAILDFVAQDGLKAEIDAIAEAWRKGKRAGAMASMRKELDSAIDAILGKRLDDGTVFLRTDPTVWNSGIEHILPVQEAAAIADQGQTIDDYFEGWNQDIWWPFLNFDIPPQGWEGWDAKAAEAELRRHYSQGQGEEEKTEKPRKRRKAR